MLIWIGADCWVNLAHAESVTVRREGKDLKLYLRYPEYREIEESVFYLDLEDEKTIKAAINRLCGR